MSKSANYNRFIFLSAGPIGDHVVVLDVASQFLKATGKPSTIITKHPNPFTDDLRLGYTKEINEVQLTSITGKMKLLFLVCESLIFKNCYILMFPIPAPKYLKIFSIFINIFTRSRVIGLNLEGTRSFPEGEGYDSWLGKENTIKMVAETFTETANKFLSFLGYKEIVWVPIFPIIYSLSVFDKLNIIPKKYIVMHLKSSGFFRSLPEDRWNKIIKEVISKTDMPIIFSGSKDDTPFIESCLSGIPRERIIISAGKINAQELLTLYKEAKVNVTVQTGNGLIINMLHQPTVVVNIKGTTMFDYTFNKKVTNLYSEKDCTCNLFETECTLLPYRGKFYMACLFNIRDEDVIHAILTKYNEA